MTLSQSDHRRGGFVTRQLLDHSYFGSRAGSRADYFTPGRAGRRPDAACVQRRQATKIFHARGSVRSFAYAFVATPRRGGSIRHNIEMMTRAMLACALVSVGSASFSSAPSFNVPQVDFGELAGLDSSAATLLLHSMVWAKNYFLAGSE
jgi:hypothetical protein